ncbi:MAG TPA: hypothetical protein VKU85_16340 [bacterium]|nr:hypothetical protein [bacterium]
MKRALHSLVALMVALPLGVGGFCCCLLGHDDAAAASVAVEATHGCCAGGETAPATPADRDPDGCDCPGLDLAVFAQGIAAPDVLASATSALPAAPPAPSAALELPATETIASAAPSPPPKLPLDRTPSLLRC